MLVLYRRHITACQHKHKGRTFKRCHCPIWIQGTLEGTPIRKALDVTSWERAEELKIEISHGNHPQTSQARETSIAEALDAYLEDCGQRNLSSGTLRKYRTLAGRIRTFAEGRRLTRLNDFSADALRDFRSSWRLGPRSAEKAIGHLRAFFAFCIQHEWIASNPAKNIKAPQVKVKPRLPFSEKEIQNILSKAKDDRELAFILSLRHTGLRIGDASLLRTSQYQSAERRIYLYTTKAGTPVSIKIPETLGALLEKLPPRGGFFFVRGESTHPHTASDLWRKRIKILCREAGITPDHPHRFRHTLAADLLSKGASVEDVAAILGNSPAVVQKYYSQWIKSRQDRLDSIVQQTWKQTLVRVK